MANPQVEEGYVRIANDVLEALCRTRIPGEAMQVFLFILRKTWGWGKKEDKISNTQIAEGTGIRRSHIHRARKILLRMNLLSIPLNGDTIPENGDTSIVTYRINKDFESWLPIPQKGDIPILGARVSPKMGSKLSPKMGPTKDKKERTKDTLSGSRKKPGTDPRIRMALDYFHQAHLRTKNMKPLLDSKAAALAKKLLAVYELDFLQNLVDEFFEAEDPFIAEAGYSFGVFYSQAQKLANRMTRGGREAWIAEMEAKEAAWQRKDAAARESKGGAVRTSRVNPTIP